MQRGDQVELLRWAIAFTERSRIGGVPVAPSALRELRKDALWASGLTATLGAQADRRQRTDDQLLADEVMQYLTQQRNEVHARTERFRQHARDVLDRLNAAGVRAVLVKGLTLTDSVWPEGGLRPMSDIDLVVRPDEMTRVTQVAFANRWPRRSTSAHETVFELWPDTCDPAFVGESRHHAGKLEVHPHWGQQLHGYRIDAPELASMVVDGTIEGIGVGVLDPVGRAVHTLSHLSCGVIRREVRPVNVLDVVMCIRAVVGTDEARLTSSCALLDPRLTAPGLWLCTAFVDDPAMRRLADAEMSRLTALKRRQLHELDAASVQRDPTRRSPLMWRLAWVRTPREARGVVREVSRSVVGRLRRRPRLFTLFAH